MNSPSPLFKAVQYGLLLVVLNLITFSTSAQCLESGAPCNAIRWEGGGSWNADGTIDDSSNSGPINGIVRCANSAETQSNIQSTGCYHEDEFAIDVSGIDCVDPSTGEIVDVLNPTEAEPLIWLNFDVRALGSDFETQINDNAGDNIGWALFYNVNPTNGTTLNVETGENLSGDLSCEQASYILIAGGSESSNTWGQLPIPNVDVTSNFYLAIWDQDADGDLSVNNFKARKGCESDITDCDTELECPDDVSFQCGEDIPDAPSLNVSEDCDDVAFISFFETDLSNPNSSICELETPGSPDDGSLYWAITLGDLPSGISSNFIWDDNGANMSLSGDELLVTGTVVNVDDEDYRFYVHFQADAGVDWDGWNGQLTTVNPFIPRTYKDDAGLAAAGGGLWTTWDFYEVDAGNAYLIGEGALSGSFLSLTHAPVNYLYGVQVGEAANTKTTDFGMASWFRANGTILNESYSGTGDISTNASCNNPTTTCSYSIIRDWTVVYESGDFSVCEQIVTVGDTQGPVIDTPGDISIDCNSSTEPVITGTATAEDNCGSATLSYSDGSITGECPSSFIRTWMAVDDCDNSSISDQVITLTDTTPPVFDSQPTDEIYVCGDDIPEAVELTATDDCSESISYSMSEVIEGNTSTDLDCSLTTAPPSPVLGSNQEWSMFLQEQGSTVREYFILDESGASFTEIPLAGGEFEAHITGTVIKADGNADESFILDVWLIEKTDYDGWTGQLTIGTPSVPRQSKTFNGVAQPGDDLTWDYWVLDSTRSELIGINDYAGDILDLEHAPSNLLFAFEAGENANNYSAGLGIGGWFKYSGTLLGEPAEGQGDFAFSAECPPCEYTITRTWTATDNCGNSSSVTQVITVNETGEIQDLDNEIQSAANGGFVNAYPNPTANTATIVYRVPADTPVTLDIISHDGRTSNRIYRGIAEAGIDNINTFDGSAYIEGMYIIRMTTASNVYYQKLILSR